MGFLDALIYSFFLLLGTLFLYGRTGAVMERDDAEKIAVLILACFIGLVSAFLAKIIFVLVL